MALVHAHLEYLVNRCGDRRIGTPGNRMAAEYIARVLESAGYDCTLERFRSPGGIQAPNAAAMLTGFFASWLMSRRGWLSHFVGLCLAGLMAAMIIGENTTRFQPAHYFVPRREGRNVLARPHGSRVPTVLVVAHYDTVNQGTAFDERWVRFVPAGLRAYALFPPMAVLLSRPRRKSPGRLFRLAMLAGAASMVQRQLLGGHNQAQTTTARGWRWPWLRQRGWLSERPTAKPGSSSPTARRRA